MIEKFSDNLISGFYLNDFEKQQKKRSTYVINQFHIETIKHLS